MSDLMTDDTTGDLVISNGDLALVDGADAVKQALRQELRMIAGEWFLDLDYGLPYYQSVLVKKPNPALIRGIFEQKILSTAGVLELLTLSIDYDASARTLAVKFNALGYDGPIDFDEVLGGTNG